MDGDEWEVVPRDELIHHQTHIISNLSNTKSVIDMNYFQTFIDHTPVKHFLENDQTSKEGCDQETIPQVSITKMEGTKFVDIEMDCSMSENKGTAGKVEDELEEKGGKGEEEEEVIKKEIGSELKDEDDNNKNNGGLNNVWKWAVSGIGAVFSFGFLAASLSLVALGNRSSTKEHPSYNPSEIHCFQIYTHDKRMKRVVKRTKRLNEGIVAVRAPYMTRAHITVGGYYEGL